jgi:hypothetical protein
MASILMGTSDGLRDLDAAVELEGHSVTALEKSGSSVWAISDGTSVQRSSESGPWEPVATISGYAGRCLLPLGDAQALVGTSKAGLMRLERGRLQSVGAFENVEGRELWYTPWGGPPDTRSLSRSDSGIFYANVHVGGIIQSHDGASWKPTGIDIHADVHQVVARASGAVLAATAYGLAVSEDDGETWTFETEGLHASYCRAVAVAGETILVSASRSHRGQQAAVYRRGVGAFERCREGLPEWFDDNIDTRCLAAADGVVALGTSDGSVFVSHDEGRTWDQAAAGQPPIRCVLVS